MSREDDAKIAKWRGMEQTHYKGSGEVRSTVPNYSDNDADAISLLPVLVARGYHPELFYGTNGKWTFVIYDKDEIALAVKRATYIVTAISGAVLELIGREGK